MRHTVWYNLKMRNPARPEKIQQPPMPAPKQPPQSTVVDDVAEQIAYCIAAGIYPAGSRLPSVRQLAVEFRINPSTVQNVLGRLQTDGFTVAHRGAGHVVQDVTARGGITTLRYLFRFAHRIPERAAAILADLLATRRTLVAEALRAVVVAPASFQAIPVVRAIERLELAVAADPADTETLVRIELDAVRALLLGVGQPVVLAIFNSVGEILLSSPEVLSAMGAEPELHVALWKELSRQWDSGELSEQSITWLSDATRDFDAQALERFSKAIARPSA